MLVIVHNSFPLSAHTLLASKPTLPELLALKTQSGSTVNVVQQIGGYYSTLGPLLLNDDTGIITAAIVSQYQLNADAINQEILTRWLVGQGKQPVSWSTLIGALKDTGLSEMAQMIQEHLIQEWQKQLKSHTQQLNKTGEAIKQLQQKIKENVNMFVLI